jgi:hypothetical protein
MDGQVANEEMPQYLSNLFTARRPLAPVPAMPKPKYTGLNSLIDGHRSLEEIFEAAGERIKANEVEGTGTEPHLTKEHKEARKHQKKVEQVKKHRETLKQAID